MYAKVKQGRTEWAVVYDKAIRDNGELFFPERLTPDFLDEQRKTLGPYIFSNQYLNEIIPGEEQDFKASWKKYFETVPLNTNTFIFLDPAISQQDTADYTAYVVVKVDENGYWYVIDAKRQRINATDTIKLIFDLCEVYQPRAFGVEIVAYQQAILHFLDEEMRRRDKIIPVTGIRRGPDKSKEQRILSLVPRFEWGRIYLTQGLVDLEDEYAKFPRGSNDDLMDALASIEEIAFKPQAEETHGKPTSPTHPDYEKHYIASLGSEDYEEAW